MKKRIISSEDCVHSALIEFEKRHTWEQKRRAGKYRKDDKKQHGKGKYKTEDQIFIEIREDKIYHKRKSTRKQRKNKQKPSLIIATQNKSIRTKLYQSDVLLTVIQCKTQAPLKIECYWLNWVIWT